MNLNEYNAKPNKSIQQHNKDLINSLSILKKFGYIKDEHIYELVKKACEYHDIGKINHEFQKRVNSEDKKIKFDPNKEVCHNILSLYFIDKDNFETEDDYYKVAHAVLQHHNYCDDVFEEMRNKKELINSLIEEFSYFKVKNKTINKLVSMVNDTESIKIKGYLHKCDYSASAGYTVEYQNDFLTDSLERLLKKWQNENQNSKWNDLQRFCIENRDNNIIAIAETGMGKTEAGLLWMGDNKGFFILPLRTAINAIYDRIKEDILNNENFENRVSILHSSSLEYYLKNISNQDDQDLDIIDYENKGKKLSIPLSISTMDQLFDFVFKYQGFELKLTTLSYSKIVIDEIQMYGPDLLAYLIYGIEKINELGGKIAILTATFPPFMKNLLEKVTFIEHAPFINENSIRHNLKAIDSKIRYEDILQKYKSNIKNGKSNKILVVCNTVKKAQEIYQKIYDKLGENDRGNLHILHAKFIRMERSDKEKEIIAFGKTYDNNHEIDKQNGIWISTSLVEASLDIDFDYLFTELLDLNSLFQRLGRCNRKGVKDNNETNCYVYLQIDLGTIKNGNKGFIDKTIYELSKEVIRGFKGPISENKKIELINASFTFENLKESDYMREYREIYDYIQSVPPYKFNKNDVDLRNILTEDIIPSPIYKKYKEEIIANENLLKDEGLSYVERIKIIDAIKKYTVSISNYQLKNYEKAKYSGKAETYRSVNIGKYEEIKIVECIYDDLGYREMDYNNAIRPTNCL